MTFPKGFGYQTIMYVTQELRKLGHSDRTIERIFNWQQRSTHLSPEDLIKITEQLQNVRTSKTVINNIIDVYGVKKILHQRERGFRLRRR